ncbi:hypothetical protein [Branchiibius sp. NY16-3462-2]|uniref:hypothetical protein n=1 Tax=Branchiibius sp. NY16-3462-2 TaxID=1807500 RepID=UPI0025C11484|nr:hypothetical protein [Branchiibius sp. NY16-3462-2]
MGTITATYDADGDLNTQTLPNGMVTRTTRDSAGFATWRTNVNGGRIWLNEYMSPDAHGRTALDIAAGASSFMRVTGYTYDRAGRLTKATDASASLGCYVRTYGLDNNSNRTSQAVYNPTSSPYWNDTCQTTAPASSTTHSYDTADRLQPSGTDTGLVYDAFGRISTLPAADAPNSGGGNVTNSYYTNDLVRSMTQNGTTTAWALDASGRFASYVTTGTGAGTKTNHYDQASGDSPDWIAENADASNYTRNITGLDGNLIATIDQTGTATYQITNQHGDVTATAAAGDTDPANYYLADEYGNPVGATTQPARYGALGADQRSTETPAAFTLMGARLYTPVLGLFLSVDPMVGGNSTSYGYPSDPVNDSDPTGNSKCTTCEGGGGGASGRHSGWSCDWRCRAAHAAAWIDHFNNHIFSAEWCVGYYCTLGAVVLRLVGAVLWGVYHRGNDWLRWMIGDLREIGMAFLGDKMGEGAEVYTFRYIGKHLSPLLKKVERVANFFRNWIGGVAINRILELADEAMDVR